MARPGTSRVRRSASVKSASIEGLTTFMVDVLVTVGVPAPGARQIADVVMDSELRGHTDHGIYFFPSVPRWITVRGVNPAPVIRVTAESGGGITVDGGGGIGVEAMNVATDRAIEVAREGGMAAATVANTDNLVALAPYVQRAADAGMIALACSGFRGPLIPPTGGLDGVFGTNPFAFAVPAGRHPAFLLDMATSAIAGGKVMEARDNGKMLSEGLLEDADGHPVTDPSLFKIGVTRLLPIAGVKGYGLAMMVDLLSTVLTGDGKWGHFIWVLNVEQFMPLQEFEARMDAEIDRIKATRRRPGVGEIFYAGERGQRRKAELVNAGRIELTPAAIEALRSASEASGVPAPLW